MRAYDVVLAAAVRERFLELDRDERELITEGLFSELRVRDGRDIEDVKGRASTKEICGYQITYRALEEAEKQRYSVTDGHFVMRMESIAKGFPGH